MIEWEKLSNFASRNKKIASHIYKVQVRFSFVSSPFQVRSLRPPPTDTYSDVINIGLPPRGRD